MPYLGKQPANVPVTADDIPDNSITSAKILDGVINIVDIANDAVTADKLANSINTDIATGVTGNTTANAALPKAGGAMTGAITTNSTFDGVDIATRDGVLTSTTATAAAALPKAGGTMTGNTVHGDNVKSLFGTSSDLEIYHDGSHSYVKDNGTGMLIIDTNGDRVRLQADGSEELANFNKNGSVELFYDNASKLATTATGVSVSGRLNVGSVATFGVVGTAATTVAYYADFPVPTSNGGNTALVEAVHSHHVMASYGCALMGWYVTYNGVYKSESTISDITTGNGGSFTVSTPTAGTLRVTHNAGTYGGGGHWFIKVTMKDN